MDCKEYHHAHFFDNALELQYSLDLEIVLSAKERIEKQP